MNCVYTYNGRDYSYAEFAAALHEGLLEDLSGKGDVVLDVEIPKIQISQKEGMGYGANDVIGNVVKTGVQDVFNSNPELASIGTQEQYSKYLDTIFPDSKIKDIVYHVTTEKFDKFDPEKQVTAGYYFTEKEPRYKGVIKEVSKKDEVILSALIDTKNPLEENTDFISESINDISHLEGFKKEGYDAIIDRKGHDEVIVFEPEQIHILGSKQDIEGFGKFVARDGEAVGEGNAQKEEVAEAQEEKEVVEEKPKQVKERFYKHVEGKGYVEVKKAKPTYLFGTEKAFYTKEGGEYIVSDALTGAEIGRSKNASQAIANAEQNAGSAENLQNARERFYEAYGQSPYAKLQQELTFTQSLVNDAIGIGDETDMEQLEDKGIIKKQCE